MESVYPFLKWCGGKRSSAPAIANHMPRDIQRYSEPMLGGGAVLLHLASTGRIRRAFCSDSNAALIETWQVVHRDPEGLTNEIYKLNPERVTRDRYLEIRDKRYDSAVKRAARFIFVNKTCFNGLYRVNSAGAFNVSWNKVERWEPDYGGIHRVSQLLQSIDVTFECCDYLESLKHSPDVIYLDPPYVPTSKTASFAGYNEERFNHEQCAQFFRAAAWAKPCESGCVALCSNSLAAESLFRGAPTRSGVVVHEMKRRGVMNSDASKRGPVTELLFINRGSNV